MTEEYEIEIIKNLNDLEIYKEDWERLYEHPNSSWIYFTTFIKNTKDIISPYVIVLKFFGKVTTILSGFIQKDIIKFLNIANFSLIKIRIKKLVIPYKYIIGELGSNTASMVCNEIDNALQKNEFQKIHMKNIEYKGCIYEYYFNNHKKMIIDENFDKKGIYRVDLDKDKDQFLNKLNKYHRRSKTPEKFSFDNIEISCYKSKDELSTFYKKAKVISQKSVKYALGYPFRETKERLRMYENLIEQNNFYAYTLSIDNEDCAFLILCIAKGICYFDQSGYDFKYKKYSPGAYLLIQALNDIMGKLTLKGIDFDPGDLSFKRRIAKSYSCVKDIKIYSKRPAAIGIYLLSQIEKKLREIRRNFLPKISFTEIKRNKIVKRLKNSDRLKTS